MKPLIALFLLTLPTMVSAKTAKELLDSCQSHNAFLNGQCFGYIEGYLDGESVDPIRPVLTMFDNGEELRLRYTDDYTLEQMEKAFIAYVDAHPEQESHPAQSALVAAWLDHKMVRLAKRNAP